MMAMIYNPLLYLFIYYKIRGKSKGEVKITKKQFRTILAKPLGIDRRLAEYLLRDLMRYHMVKEIKHGKNNYIELHGLHDNANLYNDLIALKKVRLI